MMNVVQVSILCDRVKSRNTKHPSLVSRSLPSGLLQVDSLFSLLSSQAPSPVWREMAARGSLHLQALGVDINIQVIFNCQS